MSKNMTIRDYRPADLDQVLDLVRELERELAVKFRGVSVKSSVDDYRERFLNPANKYKTFVAEFRERLVGFLLGYPSLGSPEADAMYDVLPFPKHEHPPEFYIHMVFVDRPFRKKGVSTQLHERAIAYAKEQGFKEIYACIAKWNDPELRVVHALDFKAKDLRHRYRLSLKL
jgi:L-amino acid N-acyltransferase YncA